MTKIYLVRHASPDLGRRDVPYDIHPGPQLSLKGETEAEAVAEFLKMQQVVRLYYSPFERSARTAQIIANLNHIPAAADRRLAEWREVDEVGKAVRDRMALAFDDAAGEGAFIGPIALVSHGGPIALLLLALGIQEEELAVFKKRFDGFNPLPPGGVWSAQWNAKANRWSLDLAYTPPAEAA